MNLLITQLIYIKKTRTNNHNPHQKKHTQKQTSTRHLQQHSKRNPNYSFIRKTEAHTTKQTNTYKKRGEQTN